MVSGRTTISCLAGESIKGEMAVSVPRVQTWMVSKLVGMSWPLTSTAEAVLAIGVAQRRAEMKGGYG